MLLLKPNDAATAIGAKCGGSAPSVDDPQLIAILDFITARIEGSIGVDSLTLKENHETFDLDSLESNQRYSPALPKKRIRLCNGFLIRSSLDLTDPNGNLLLEEVGYDTDYAYGVITLRSWVAGRYTIKYQSGFEPICPIPPTDNEEALSRLVLADVPVWMKSLATTCLVLWYRFTFLQPKISKELARGADTLDSALRREITTGTYTTYMRPRVNCVFTDKC